MKRYISEAKRQMVIARANNCCEYCKLPQFDAFQKHQINPSF